MVDEVKFKLAIDGVAKVNDQMESVSKSLDNLRGSLTKTAHYGSALAVSMQYLVPSLSATVTASIKAADSVTTLHNQLKLATTSTTEAKQAYAALFDIAQQSRVSFTELGTTFASISRAGQELGVSQHRLLAVTQSIGSAMAISGGSAQGMQAALTQLSQGLASGTLWGDELNSVLEQAPRLAKALADGMGVSTGELRKLGEQGEITAARVIDALEKSGPQLAKELESSALTVGQSMTVMSNSVVRFVGEIDAAVGLSTKLSDAIKYLSKTMDTASGSKSTVGFLTDDFKAAGQAMDIAQRSGSGFFMQLNSGLGMLIGRTLSLQYLNRDFMTLEQAVASSTATIARLDALEKANGALSIKSMSDRAEAVRDLARANRELAGTKQAPQDSAAVEAARIGGMARERVMAQIDKDQSAAGALKLKLSGVSKEYIDTMKEIGRLHAAGALTGKDYTNAIADAHDMLKKGTTTLSDAAKGLALYNDLTDKAAGFDATWAENVNLLRKAVDGGKISQDQYGSAIDALLKKQPLMAAAEKARIDAAQLNTKAVDDLFEAQEKLRLVNEDQIKAGRTMLEQIEFEARLLGMNAEQRAQATLERELETKGIVKGTQAYEAYIQRLRDATSLKTATESGIKAAQDLADANKKAAEESSKYWEDALMRAFESGKGFFDALFDTIKNTLKTQVLKVTVQGVMGSMGLGAAGAANAGGFFGSASGSFTGNALGSPGAGTLFASNAAYGAAIGTTSIGAGSQAAMLAAQTGDFGAAGLSATAASGGGAAATAASAMPYVAAALIAYNLLQGNGGTPTQGTGQAQRIYDPAGNVAITTAKDEWGGLSLRAEAAITAMHDSYMASVKALGLTAAASTFAFGSNTGKDSAGNNFALLGGAGASSYSSGGEQAYSDAAMALEASRAVFAALKGSDLPAYLAKVFDGITVGSATQDQINAALQYAGSLKAVRDALLETRAPLQIVQDTVASATAALGTSADTFKADFVAAIDAGIAPDKLAAWQALGVGLDQLKTAANETAAAAQAAADKLAATNQGWQDKLDVLLGTQTERSLALRDATDGSTRALMQQVYAQEDLQTAAEAAAAAQTAAAEATRAALQTLATEVLTALSGMVSSAEQALQTATSNLQAAYNAEAAALTATQNRFEGIGKTYRAFADSLGGALDAPAQSLERLQAQYTRLTDMARLGDADAASQAVGVGAQLKDSMLARLSGTDAALAIARLQVSALATAGMADTQASVAQQSLDALTAQVGALVALNASVLSVKDAVAAFHGAQNTLDTARNTLLANLAGNIASAVNQGQLATAIGLLSDNFAAFDANASAGLTLDELTTGLKSVASADQIKGVIELLDLNNNGIISKIELETAKVLAAMKVTGVNPDTGTPTDFTGLDVSKGIASMVAAGSSVGDIMHAAYNSYKLSTADLSTIATTAGYSGITGYLSAAAAQRVFSAGDQATVWSMATAAAAASGKSKEWEFINWVKANGANAGQADKAFGLASGTTNAWAVANGLPAFDVGTNYVPFDMTARIHAGEEITPRPFVDLQRDARNETNALLQRLLASNAALRDEVAELRRANTQENTIIATQAALTADSTRSIKNNGVMVVMDPNDAPLNVKVVTP